jgi:hypothetical protein
MWLPEKETKKIYISETENGTRDDGEVNDRKKDGWMEGLTNRQTETKKERRRTNGCRALLSHCPGRDPRMSVTNTQTDRHHVCFNI